MQYLGRFILPGILVAVVSYLLGSVNFAIIFTKAFKNGADIRDFGSGNAGATNVLRSVGALPSALTFICDFLKCAASVVFGGVAFRYAAALGQGLVADGTYGAYLAGICCLVGHIFPIFFGFRGGKGVVTCAAMIALLDWRVFIILISVFIVVFALKRIVSLGSIIAIALNPPVTFLVKYFCDYKKVLLPMWDHTPLSNVITSTVFALIITVIILITHLPNIRRLKAGTEKELKL